MCFEIEENSSGIQALDLFPKYVNVFDCIHIYAEQSISDQKDNQILIRIFNPLFVEFYSFF